MRLESFRVRNYRSINDSGEIAVSRITALLGRNESGKSNLLRALHSLNPIEGFSALKPIKDFPRHRRLEECTDDTPVLSTTWVSMRMTRRHYWRFCLVLPTWSESPSDAVIQARRERRDFVFRPPLARKKHLGLAT